jgi:hypothetical protein
MNEMLLVFDLILLSESSDLGTNPVHRLRCFVHLYALMLLPALAMCPLREPLGIVAVDRTLVFL